MQFIDALRGCEHAFLRVRHAKTEVDRRCDQALLPAARAAGSLGNVMELLEQHSGGLNMQKWVHRVGELSVQLAFDCDRLVASGDAASTFGCRALSKTPLSRSVGQRPAGFQERCQQAMRDVGVHRMAHHPVHGAMWTIVVEGSNTSHDVWEAHRVCASPYRHSDFHLWIDACHGVGHGLSWWAPDGVRSPALALGEAFLICEKQPQLESVYDHRCVAACADGVLHESMEAHIYHNWALPMAGSSINGSESGQSVYAVCDSVPRNSFFCYHWLAAQVTFEGCEALLSFASLANVAGCFAAARAGPAPTTRLTLAHVEAHSNASQPRGVLDAQSTAAEEARRRCDELRSRSFSFYVACTYGTAHNRAHEVFNGGGYAPWFRKHLLADFVWPQCRAHDDHLVRVLCDAEIYDGFSGAALLNDEELLAAFREVPLDADLLSEPRRKAIYLRAVGELHNHMVDLAKQHAQGGRAR